MSLYTYGIPVCSMIRTLARYDIGGGKTLVTDRSGTNIPGRQDLIYIVHIDGRLHDPSPFYPQPSLGQPR
jgi:hypothetical protein